MTGVGGRRDVTSPAIGGPVRPFRMDCRSHTPSCHPKVSGPLRRCPCDFNILPIGCLAAMLRSATQKPMSPFS
jgi:hypothetical protein